MNAENESNANIEGFLADDDAVIDQGMDIVDEAADEDLIDNSRAKRKCLIFLLAVALIAGVFYGSGPETSDYQGPIDLAHSFIVTFAVLFWCYLDAEERNYSFSRKFSIFFVFFPYICFPLYVFKLRKGMACLRVFIRTTVFFVFYLIAISLGYALGLLSLYMRQGFVSGPDEFIF